MARQNKLEPSDYHKPFFMEMDSVDEDQLMALENIQLNNFKVAQTYNKHVRKKKRNSRKVISFGKPFCQSELDIQHLAK